MTWESRHSALVKAGNAIKRRKVAETVARSELEPDEYMTAEQKAEQINSNTSAPPHFISSGI